MQLSALILTLLAYMDGSSWRTVHMRAVFGVGPDIAYSTWLWAAPLVLTSLRFLAELHREASFQELRDRGVTSLCIMLDATFATRRKAGGSQQGALTWGTFGPAPNQYNILGAETMERPQWRQGKCYNPGTFDGSSHHMEVAAARNLANRILDAGFDIEMVCHDRCAAVYIVICQVCRARGRPIPLERLDWGHEAKNIKKRFAKKTGALKYMADRVKNHFLRCVQEADRSLDVFRDLWGQGLRHFAGLHDRCQHGPIDEHATAPGHPQIRKYLDPAAMLPGAPLKKRLAAQRAFAYLTAQFQAELRDAAKFIDRVSTNCLESLHSGIHHFAPKLKHFSKTYEARCLGAVLARVHGRGSMVAMVLAHLGIVLNDEQVRQLASIDEEFGSQGDAKRRPAGYRRKHTKPAM